MRVFKTLFVCSLAIVLMLTSLSFAGSNARRPAIIAGADNVKALQRTDTGWEGTWYWYVGSTGNATNLTGVTALGLLEAYNDTKDQKYLDAAKESAAFIMAHLGAGATGTKYHVRTTAPDIVFLHKLAQVTGDAQYSTRANVEWENITNFWSTAGNLDALFRAINRPSTWDIAFFLEAAFLSGDTEWANQAAAILANNTDAFYYDNTSPWYALNLAGSVRALVGCGYFQTYSDATTDLLYKLISLIDDENGIDGYVQDTAYAVLALNSVGGGARSYANGLGRWLASKQEENKGWVEPDLREYPEADGEAVRALAATIGSNITIDGFEPGLVKKSYWKRALSSEAAKPFDGE